MDTDSEPEEEVVEWSGGSGSEASDRGGGDGGGATPVASPGGYTTPEGPPTPVARPRGGGTTPGGDTPVASPRGDDGTDADAEAVAEMPGYQVPPTVPPPPVVIADTDADAEAEMPPIPPPPAVIAEPVADCEEAFDWGPHHPGERPGFHFHYSPPDKRPPHGQWQVLCYYHKLNDNTACTRSVSCLTAGGKAQALKILKVWCTRAPIHNRKRHHWKDVVQPWHVPDPEIIEARARSMRLPPLRAELKTDDQLDEEEAEDELASNGDDAGGDGGGPGSGGGGSDDRPGGRGGRGRGSGRDEGR